MAVKEMPQLESSTALLVSKVISMTEHLSLSGAVHKLAY